MRIPAELLPVLQITAPLIVSIFLAMAYQNKRIDDVNKRIDDLTKRFDGLEKRIDDLRNDMNRQFEHVFAELRGIRADMAAQGERISRLEGPRLVRP
jgi:hypothetical protein